MRRSRQAARFHPIISLVGERRPRRDVGADVKRRFELCAVAGLATGQMEFEWEAVEVGLEMDFARESAARTAERLILLPPFAPAAETWARTTVLSNIWTMRAVWLSPPGPGRTPRTRSGLEPPEPLPNRVPLPNSAGSARQVTL